MPKDKRTFITIAVDMPDHPKLAPLTGAQKWEIVDALCYARKYTTDGVIELPVWRKKYTKRNRDAILATGFAVEFRAGVIVSGPAEIRQDSDRIAAKFESATGGKLPTDCVLFPDYFEHQQTKAEVEHAREVRSSAGRKGGRQSGETRRRKASGIEANASANAEQTGKQNEPEEEEEEERDTPSGVSHTSATPTCAPEPKPKRPPKTEPRDPDRERLCELLRDQVLANGFEVADSDGNGAISDAWRRACRLMVERDGRTIEQIHDAIMWSTNHSFWQANVRSMAKLRAQYGELQAQAKRDARNGRNGAAPSKRQTQRDALDAITARFEAQLAGSADPDGYEYDHDLIDASIATVHHLPALEGPAA